MPPRNAISPPPKPSATSNFSDGDRVRTSRGLRGSCELARVSGVGTSGTDRAQGGHPDKP